MRDFFFQASPAPGQEACERLSCAAFLIVSDQSMDADFGALGGFLMLFLAAFFFGADAAVLDFFAVGM
jgi:hypothetical protein